MTRSRTVRTVGCSEVAKATRTQARGGFSGAVDEVLGSVLEPSCGRGVAIGGNEAGRGTNIGRDEVAGQVRDAGERV